MKVFLRIVLVVVAVIVLAAAGGTFYITRGLNEGAKVQIGNVDLATVADGVYDGKYKSGRWTNELNVTVKEHKITDIKVVKDVTFSNEASAQQLFDKIIDKQEIAVDAVSGATVTSKAYQKSIENALSK